MLKRRASLLRFLCIQGQAGELGELLTDQSDRHKVILLNTRVLFFTLIFAVYTTNSGSCMHSRRLLRLDTPLVSLNNYECPQVSYSISELLCLRLQFVQHWKIHSSN